MHIALHSGVSPGRPCCSSSTAVHHVGSPGSCCCSNAAAGRQLNEAGYPCCSNRVTELARQSWPLLLQQSGDPFCCSLIAAGRQLSNAGSCQMAAEAQPYRPSAFIACSSAALCRRMSRQQQAAQPSASLSVWPLQPCWSWCMCPRFCCTLPAEPGMLMGPHLCTPWSSPCSPTWRIRSSASGHSLSISATSAPWRLTCTCRGWDTTGSCRSKASGAQAASLLSSRVRVPPGHVVLCQCRRLT